VIEAQNLSMAYGATRALQGVSFSVRDGEVVGLLGPNGAGKTTIMRILTTFIYPTGGTAVVAGHDVTAEPLAVRRAIGYLPESPPLYADMRVDEFLGFVGRARNLSGPQLANRLAWVTEACGIASVWKHAIHELSLGYRQRVGLAQALVHDPRVIILDEPTSGLDPIQIIGIRKLVRELARGRTILFSTHILQEAAAISDRLLIINAGRIVAHGTPDELRVRRGAEACTLAVEGDRREVESALGGVRAVENLRFVGDGDGGQRFTFTTAAFQEAAVAINRLAREKNWLLKELSREKAPLEDVFLGFFEKNPK
jgi:ABC-2 type transport system ATP-binding protein